MSSQANFHTSSTPPAIDIYKTLRVAPAASVAKLIARSRGGLPPFTAVEWLTPRRSTSQLHKHARRLLERPLTTGEARASEFGVDHSCSLLGCGGWVGLGLGVPRPYGGGGEPPPPWRGGQLTSGVLGGVLPPALRAQRRQLGLARLLLSPRSYRFLA